MRRPTRFTDAPTPGPERRDYANFEDYLQALDAWGEANGGLADDPLDLMDELASIRVASYEHDARDAAIRQAENVTWLKTKRPS